MIHFEITPQRTYVLRLVRGEDVFQTLTDFCERAKVAHAHFTGIGAVEKVKLGYYDISQKTYGFRLYDREHEVASMTGNVVLVDEKPFIHMHAVLSGVVPGTENQCVGGHVFEATVAVTLEVHLIVFHEPMTRTFDEGVGLKLLDCVDATLTGQS